MSEERLEIPIDVDLSPMRTALAQLDTSVNAVPHVDLTPMVSEVGRLGHEVTKITTDGAANTAIGEVDGVPLDPDDELRIDVDGAEVVDQHGGPHAVFLTQDVIQQRRLAGAEEPADERDRNHRWL